VTGRLRSLPSRRCHRVMLFLLPVIHVPSLALHRQQMKAMSRRHSSGTSTPLEERRHGVAFASGRQPSCAASGAFRYSDTHSLPHTPSARREKASKCAVCFAGIAYQRAMSTHRTVAGEVAVRRVQFSPSRPAAAQARHREDSDICRCLPRVCRGYAGAASYTERRRLKAVGP